MSSKDRKSKRGSGPRFAKSLYLYPSNSELESDLVKLLESAIRSQEVMRGFVLAGYLMHKHGVTFDPASASLKGAVSMMPATPQPAVAAMPSLPVAPMAPMAVSGDESSPLDELPEGLEDQTHGVPVPVTAKPALSRFRSFVK